MAFTMTLSDRPIYIDRAVVGDARFRARAAGRRFEAELCFPEPSDLKCISADGFTLAIDWDEIDDYGPSLFGRIAGRSELDEHRLNRLLDEIIEPYGGLVETFTWT
jgi:hypothetical protein